MINQRLRLTAGIMACMLAFSSVPADAMATQSNANDEYVTSSMIHFSAGVHSAITETVVLNDEDTGVTENDAPVVAEPQEPGTEGVEGTEGTEGTEGVEGTEGAEGTEGTEGVEGTEGTEDTQGTEDSETTEVVNNKYANMAIADKISVYLNVRKGPSAQEEVVGKLYPNNAAVVLEDHGTWYRIVSGNIEGYISAEYVTVGDEALCKSVSKTTAKITTNCLRLRKEPNTGCDVYTLLGIGQTVTVLDDSIDGWLKVSYASYTGYISSDYAEVTTVYTYGETKEEEQKRVAAEKAAEEARKKAEKEAEEARKKAEAEAAAKKKAEAEAAANSNKFVNPEPGSGEAVVNYALQFVGNPYVWGGESLTKGADCSGYVMKIYEHFGIKLPHSSYKLRSVGVAVREADIRPGDIVCYSGHVAIYIGNGKIVHAANSKDGIKISDNFKYKTVLAIRRVI